jgi:glycosyltransferase involved in cell wall biosynthesis
MKILHIVSGDLQEGAARGAVSLHFALTELGVTSALLVDGILGDHPSHFGSNRHKISRLRAKMIRRVNRIPTSFYGRNKEQAFTNNVIGRKLSKNKQINNFDILHFHWVDSAAFDYRDLEDISHPIVWTLRDMWVFTGGCHYTYECTKYIEKCGLCPQLSSEKVIDLSSSNIMRKSSVEKQITYVAVSNWLKQRALESSVLKDQEINVVHNGVDTDIFFPKKEESIRKKLRIEKDTPIVLVGALDLNDKYKGLDLLVQALSTIGVHFAVLSFGKSKIADKFDSQIQVFDMGYFSDPCEMAKLYNSADLFVSASINEAFGKTVTESLACGTPVVCFSQTGSAEIVIDGKTGAIAKNASVESLAKCITSQLLAGKTKEKIEACRTSILNHFQNSEMAHKYLQIYREINPSS